MTRGLKCRGIGADGLLGAAAYVGSEKLCDLAVEWGANDYQYMLDCAAAGGREGICRRAIAINGDAWNERNYEGMFEAAETNGCAAAGLLALEHLGADRGERLVVTTAVLWHLPALWVYMRQPSLQHFSRAWTLAFAIVANHETGGELMLETLMRERVVHRDAIVAGILGARAAGHSGVEEWLEQCFAAKYRTDSGARGTNAAYALDTMERDPLLDGSSFAFLWWPANRR